MEVYYTATLRLKIKARDRDEAIEKTSLRAKRRGIEPITLRVPFLEGDHD